MHLMENLMEFLQKQLITLERTLKKKIIVVVAVDVAHLKFNKERNIFNISL